MRKKLFFLILGLLVLIGVLYALVWWRGFLPGQGESPYAKASIAQHDVTVLRYDNRRVYDAADEIAEAKEKLSAETEMAEIKKKADASQRKVTLVFSGMATPAEMEQILTMVREYEAAPVFVLDGMSAAEDPDSARNIASGGYELGNYGLKAEPHWENASEEALVESVVYTQVVLKSITRKIPDYFLGNATSYTDEVLHAVYCSGINQVIEPSSFVSSTSFPSFTAAMGYVNTLEDGDIICVKLEGALDDFEYDKLEMDIRTVWEPHEMKVEEIELPETSIVTTVEYLLEALRTTQTAVVPLSRLYLEYDPEVAELFNEENKAAEMSMQGVSTQTEYFDHVLMIGDSLTRTLANLDYPNGLADHADICAYVSITPAQIMNNVTAENIHGEQVAVWDEITSHDPRIVYVLLGSNSLGVDTDEHLIQTYNLLLDKLKTAFPNAEIIVEGLTPVSRKVSSDQLSLTNGRIRALNVRLAEMASENGLRYLDTYSALCNEDGDLPTNLCREDGIHLNAEGSARWVAFLQSNAVSTEFNVPGEDEEEELPAFFIELLKKWDEEGGL